MTVSKDGRMTARDGQKFPISVNGVQLRLAESSLDGGAILDEAGCRPAEDHVLIQLLFPGTRSVGLDEAVDVGSKSNQTFRAFKSDRIFRFTIDDRGYEWGAARVTEPELRDLAVVDADDTLALEHDGNATDLAAGATVELADAGTERLCVVRLVTVTLNGEVEKRIPAGSYTTEELIRVLDVEDGYVLNLLDAQGKLKRLQRGQTTLVSAGLKFYTHVPTGGSS